MTFYLNIRKTIGAKKHSGRFDNLKILLTNSKWFLIEIFLTIPNPGYF